jgi:hypothetical protein
VHGAEMYYTEAGSGPPRLFSPGGLQGVLASYQPVLEGLSCAYRVMADDRRFGGQAKLPIVVGVICPSPLMRRTA